MSEEHIRIAHVLGRRFGLDVQGWAEFKSLVEAHVRLGNAIHITIDQYGQATIEAPVGSQSHARVEQEERP